MTVAVMEGWLGKRGCRIREGTIRGTLMRVPVGENFEDGPRGPDRIASSSRRLNADRSGPTKNAGSDARERASNGEPFFAGRP
jgi:hypothetical protein